MHTSNDRLRRGAVYTGEWLGSLRHGKGAQARRPPTRRHLPGGVWRSDLFARGAAKSPAFRHVPSRVRTSCRVLPYDASRRVATGLPTLSHEALCGRSRRSCGSPACPEPLSGRRRPPGSGGRGRSRESEPCRMHLELTTGPKTSAKPLTEPAFGLCQRVYRSKHSHLGQEMRLY